MLHPQTAVNQMLTYRNGIINRQIVQLYVRDMSKNARSCVLKLQHVSQLHYIVLCWVLEKVVLHWPSPWHSGAKLSISQEQAIAHNCCNPWAQWKVNVSQHVKWQSAMLEVLIGRCIKSFVTIKETWEYFALGKHPESKIRCWSDIYI